MFADELFGKVTYRFETLLEPLRSSEVATPGLFHTIVTVDQFRYCKRLDWYCQVDTNQGKALFFDTGHPALTGMAFFDETLSRNGLRWNQVDIFLTHFHVDHAGNLPYCLNQGVQSASFVAPMPYKDSLPGEFLTWTRSSEVMCNDSDTIEHLELLYGKDYLTDIPLERCCEVAAGDTFSIGDFHWEVLPTPGHTSEHACLIERDRQILLSGDHLIYAKPGMTQLIPDEHLIAQYLQSMSDLRAHTLRLVLMSHHEPLEGKDVINAFLKKTQDGYLDLLDVAQDQIKQWGAVTAYDMACKIADEHYPDGIDTFRPDVQMRRVGLTFGTLEGLYDEGRVERRQDDDGAFVYFTKRRK